MALVANLTTIQGLDGALREFQTVLTVDQRRQLQEIKTVPDTDAVLVFTAQLDAQNAKRKGRSVATRLHTFLQCARDFSAVVDTFVSSHPEIAALVWGSIKLTMLILTNFLSYYESLTELFLDLGRICPRFAEYQALYPTSTRLQKSLCQFHAAIVTFCKHVVEALQRPWQQQLLKTFGGPLEEEFKPDRANIEKCSNDVKEELILAKSQADFQEQQLQEKERQKASKSRWKLKKFTERTDDKLDHMGAWQLNYEKRRAEERKQQLLDSLSKHDYLTPFKQSRRKRYPGTATWLLETPQFKAWFDGTGSQVLWCGGKMEKRNSKTLAAFFFLRFDDQESLKAETILRSIVRQALQSITLAGELEALLEDASLDTLAGLRDISSLLAKSADRLDNLYVVVDGVDECDQSERPDLLRELSWICSSCLKIRVFLASRESLSDEILRAFPTLERVSMSCPSAEAEVSAFIAGAIKERLENGDLTVGNPSLVDDITHALVNGAEGMFLWVSFQIHELCSQHCDEDIRKTIGNLPRGLTETFNRALDRIITQGKGGIARDTFLWVIAATRNLSLDELREAIGVEIGQPYSRPERHVNGIRKLGSWCGNLVEVDEENNTVQLVHHSVRSFLLDERPEQRFRQFHIDAEQADHHLGEICVTYLKFNDFVATVAQRPQTPPPITPKEMASSALGYRPGSLASRFMDAAFRSSRETRLSASQTMESLSTLLRVDSRAAIEKLELGYPFLKYAASHWMWHTRRFGDEFADIWEDLVTNYGAVARVPWSSSGSFETDLGKAVTWASNADHYNLLRVLIKPERYIHRHSDEIDDLMDEAVRRLNAGPLEIQAIYPMTKGCLVVHCGGLGAFAALHMTMGGVRSHAPREDCPGYHNEEVLEYVLWLASRRGERTAVRNLLAAGASPNSTAPTIYSVDHGTTTILFRSEEDYERFASPLRIAASKGYIDIVDELLSAGAKLDQVTVDIVEQSGHAEVIQRVRADRKELDNCMTSLRSSGL